MKRNAGLIALAAFFTYMLHAQDRSTLIPGIGVEAGVPLTPMFSTYSISALDYPVRYTPYSSSVPWYQVGAYATFRLPKHLSFEVDGLYRRAEFAFEQPLNQFYTHTHFNSWQFPFMFQYSFTRGHLRPFVDAGASFRHIAGVQTSFYGPGRALTLGPQNTSDVLRNSSSWGGVAGVGITFKEGPLEFRPQIRYTRWMNQSFNAVGLTNNLNESVLLLGIGF